MNTHTPPLKNEFNRAKKYPSSFSHTQPYTHTYTKEFHLISSYITLKNDHAHLPPLLVHQPRDRDPTFPQPTRQI